MDILGKIIEIKRARLATSQNGLSEAQLRQEAILRRKDADAHALVQALNGNSQLRIIAEFKRRSPSKGIIRDDVSPDVMARYYEAGGAAAISVLTEEDHFAGSLLDLRLVRQTVTLPILRKDFVFTEYQIYETAAAGADAVLLIAAVLEDDTLAHLRSLAEDELGLDALIEVHTSEEMTKALAAGAKLIGVNNRDLKTFALSLEASVRLAREAHEDSVLISESGLSEPSDIARLRSLGYRGFLIGESLMRATDPVAALRELIGKEQGA